MTARETLAIVCAALVLAGALVFVGCGMQTYTKEDLAGSKYLFNDESVDSRTIDLRPDGTFQYDIVYTDSTYSIEGNYTVEGDKLTLNFNESERVGEYSGKTLEFEIINKGKGLKDEEDLGWLKL